MNEKAWDNRVNTDKYRVLATTTVLKQLNSGEANNDANAASVAKATSDAADKIKATNLNLEGANQNNWHEYWVTKHRIQGMRDHTAANGLVTENAIEHKPFW